MGYNEGDSRLGSMSNKTRVFRIQVRSTARCRPAVDNLPCLPNLTTRRRTACSETVIPAQAGIQTKDMPPVLWIPACAGMTIRVVHRALNDADCISHKGTKDTKELTAVETPLCTLCLCARKNWKTNNQCHSRRNVVVSEQLFCGNIRTLYG